MDKIDVSLLTKEQRQDVDEHYRKEFADLVRTFKESFGSIAKAQDMLAMAWIVQVFNTFVVEALKYFPDDEAVDPGLLVCNWPRKQNQNLN